MLHTFYDFFGNLPTRTRVCLLKLKFLFFLDETNDRWWGESAVPPAPAVAAVPPQRPSVSSILNITNINRDEPSALPPRHMYPHEGNLLFYFYFIYK